MLRKQIESTACGKRTTGTKTYSSLNIPKRKDCTYWTLLYEGIGCMEDEGQQFS